MGHDCPIDIWILIFLTSMARYGPYLYVFCKKMGTLWKNSSFITDSIDINTIIVTIKTIVIMEIIDINDIDISEAIDTIEGIVGIEIIMIIIIIIISIGTFLTEHFWHYLHWWYHWSQWQPWQQWQNGQHGDIGSWKSKLGHFLSHINNMYIKWKLRSFWIQIWHQIIWFVVENYVKKRLFDF